MALNNVGTTPGFNPLGGGRAGFQAQTGLAPPNMQGIGGAIAARNTSGLPLRQQNFLPNQPQANGAPQAVQNQGQVSAPVSQQVPAQSLMQPPQPQPAFGLSGAEQALQAGATAGVGAVGQGQQSALGTLLAGNQFAQNQLQQGGQVAQGQLQQGVNALGGDFSAQAQQVDPNTGQPLFQQAAGGVNQFTGAGVSAQQRQAALTGAFGPEAQQQAFATFTESPGQAFLREQGLRQVANAASATGGLVGGNVLSELQRQGQGLAQQDFANQFNRLGSLSSQGLQAAGQAGQFLSQAGQQQAQLAAQNAQLGTQANLASAGNRLSARQGQANLFGQGAGIGASLAGQGANIGSNLAGQGAGIQFGAGQNVANILGGAGQNIADARFQTGRDLASQIGQSTSALSNLADRQGSGLADIIGAGGSNLANLISNSGQLDAAQQTQLAQILANLETGSGTQLSNITLGQGANASQAALAQGANQQQLLGNLAGVFGSVQGGSRPIFEP